MSEWRRHAVTACPRIRERGQAYTVVSPRRLTRPVCGPGTTHQDGMTVRNPSGHWWIWTPLVRLPCRAGLWCVLSLVPCCHSPHESSPVPSTPAHPRHLRHLPNLGVSGRSIPVLVLSHLRHLPRPIALLWPRPCPRHSPILYTFDFIKQICFDGSSGTTLTLIKAYAAKATRIVCKVYDGFGKFGCGGAGVWAVRHWATVQYGGSWDRVNRHRRALLRRVHLLKRAGRR